MFDLSEKIALITGAASGIGAAIAETYCRAGAFVYVTDIDEDKGRKVVASLTGAGGKCEFLRLDVSSRQECEKVAAEVLQRSGRLDILVNNAGIGAVGNILATTEVELERQWAVNVKGPFNMSRAFLPSMLARKCGVIINMASIGGVVGVRDRVAYCMTKFAVVGLTKSMALDHAHEGIRVNCICPGRVYTDFVEQRLKEYPDPERAFQEMSATQAVGRMGKPKEIAAAALYLASDEAEFVTGTTLMTDGGWSAGK
ncbi:SDR family oxidoreductase [bacterium]|nr:SDR family oxidoreductase [bacterium]